MSYNSNGKRIRPNKSRSVSANGLAWQSVVSGSLKNMGPKHFQQAPKVFIGPSVEGKRTKLVEVITGSVLDKKPFYA